ncbi:DUF2207 domain-containing protein [Cecembia calidifontis]|jgi:uncharacterized membrane protein YgcG|uniref:Putative membrane protein DUF2207 n=1 Tax=Cecembia calidifontis TaxID=1187080 RepID=A0A4Q7P739_9BACT|nr:DUF2207 domain-containing protein [Cecembia calidifontis]RZS95290.1 putative membrane protein DUF2207 [Cecembia calidifontis]
MKNFLLFIGFFLSLQVLGQEEYIRSFHTDLKVDTSGLLSVTETIEVFASGNQIKRGIVRSLPLQGIDYRYRQVKNEYQIISVERDGSTEPFHTEKKQGSLFIYIGDKDVFLDPGYYTFTITYAAKGQLGFFEDYDEIYWNVNGFGWDFRVEKISATVSIPIEADFKEYACYTGYSGSTEQNCKIEKLADGRLFFEAENLSAYQNLTIAAGFTKGVVSPPPPLGFWEQFGFLVLSGITFLVLLLYYAITWYKFGIDPPKPTVIPEFDPPSGISPASLGMIHRGYFGGDLISASIVHLAVNGYLRIVEKSEPVMFGLFHSNSFTLIKLKNPDAFLPQEEKVLMDKLFPNNSVQISISGSYNSQLKSMYDSYVENLMRQHRPFLNQGSNWKLWIPPIFIFIVYAIVASRFDFYNYAQPNLSFDLVDISPFPIVIFIAVLVIISIVRKEMGRWVFLILILLSFLIGSYMLYQSSTISLNNLVLIGFILFAVVSYFSYIYLIRQPSIEKLDLKSRIEGFKKYLSAAEERQLQMFNPPKMTPEIFEKLLPFAMAFKVDKIWGKKFQNLMERSSLNQRHQTTWYSGSRFYSYHLLGNHINKALGTSINHSAGRGGGGSGSSGGGSSGGGRGGGGGGGW